MNRQEILADYRYLGCPKKSIYMQTVLGNNATLMCTTNNHKNVVTHVVRLIVSCRSNREFSGSPSDAIYACVGRSIGQKITPQANHRHAKWAHYWWWCKDHQLQVTSIWIGSKYYIGNNFIDYRSSKNSYEWRPYHKVELILFLLLFLLPHGTVSIHIVSCDNLHRHMYSEQLQKMWGCFCRWCLKAHGTTALWFTQSV